jgi:hypothetical protein
MSLARPNKSETLSQATEALHRGDETAISEDRWRKSGDLAKETKNWCQTLARRVPSERAETGTVMNVLSALPPSCRNQQKEKLIASCRVMSCGFAGPPAWGPPQFSSSCLSLARPDSGRK